MLDTSSQTEQQIRNLSATTTALADQTTHIRETMEQQGQRLISGLTEAVVQMDTTSKRLQQSVAEALQGADQVGSRYDTLTSSATMRIGSAGQELLSMADRTDKALGGLSANMTQQVAALNLLSEQMTEQNQAITVSHSSQKEQLVDLFEKIGTAHAQASEVADRTIVRLADSLQQIQRQLGVLSDQSQSTVANVRTASSGFADQAAVLVQQAQAAEQQARTVLSVTGALQEQAKQLRESMHQEGERTSEVLGNMLSKLTTGSAELREMGTAAEGTLTSLQANVTKQTADFAGTMQQIGERQRSLTTALDAQRDVLNGLLVRLTLAQDETGRDGGTQHRAFDRQLAADCQADRKHRSTSAKHAG